MDKHKQVNGEWLKHTALLKVCPVLYHEKLVPLRGGGKSRPTIIYNFDTAPALLDQMRGTLRGTQIITTLKEGLKNG